MIHLNKKEIGVLVLIGLLALSGCGGGSTSETVSATGQIQLIGNKIFDKAGRQVIARGPETIVAQEDFTEAIDQIANTGANAIRIMMTIDAVNGMTPEAFDAVYARAVARNLLIWASFYTWNNVENNPINAALGGGNFYELTAPSVVLHSVWNLIGY